MENKDWPSILADMEAKKTALETAIAGLRAALATGALGVAIGDSIKFQDSVAVSLSPATGSSPQGAISLPRGAFLGKTATDAIRLYLSAARCKQTNKEIAQALKDGGLESVGKNFDNYITHGLFRLRKEGAVLRFDDGWGLAEWYPESFRTRIIEKKVAPKRRKAKKSVKAKSTVAPEKKAPASPPAPQSLDRRIEEVLKAKPDQNYSAHDLAAKLSVSVGSVNFALGRLVRQHLIEKTADGYRASTGHVQEISRAV